MWRVAGPSEYLAIAGGSIKDVRLAKVEWIWPTVYAGKTKMKGKVGAGQTKHNALKTDLETKAKMKAAKTDLETKNTATGMRKAKIKETTTRAAKISKNQAADYEAWPQKGNIGKDRQKGGSTQQQYMKGCLKDPKRLSKGQKKTVRFNLPEDDFGSRCKRQTGELCKNKRGQGEKGEQQTLKHYGSSRTPLLTHVLSIR